MWIQLMRPTSLNKKQETKHKTKGVSIKNIFRGISSEQIAIDVQESEMIAEDDDLFDIAPHDELNCTKVLTFQDSILKNALPGDYIRFMKYVGEGGAHRLLVNKFRVLIQMFPNYRH